MQGIGYINIATVTQSIEGLFNNFKNVSGYSNLRTSQIRLYESFQDVIRRTGKQPEEITFEEFESTFPEVFVEHENQLSLKLAELFVKYRMDQIDLLATKVPDDEITKRLGEPPWDVVRRILEIAKLPFEITDPSRNRLREPFHLKLTHRVTGDTVGFHELSSGEKVLMSLVVYYYTSKEKNIHPKLFLLDEPDAHLHPSMSQVFIDVMKKVLVDEMGVRVIMSTHSPSTVALAPEESIFVASNEGPRISKAGKDAALKLLTAGVPSFSVNYENRRQVFVESQYDVTFYEGIYERIQKHLEPEVSLTFIASGDIQTDRNGMPKSNCAQVKKATDLLRNAGNRFVWGLVDWDLENNETDFIKVLGHESLPRRD